METESNQKIKITSTEPSKVRKCQEITTSNTATVHTLFED
jgi:hypothetical protein